MSNIIISGADITNVDRLFNLKSVGGNLFIEHSLALGNIDGLVNITSVGGDLHIGFRDMPFTDNNTSLTNIDGLSSLTVVV